MLKYTKTNDTNEERAVTANKGDVFMYDVSLFLIFGSLVLAQKITGNAFGKLNLVDQTSYYNKQFGSKYLPMLSMLPMIIAAAMIFLRVDRTMIYTAIGLSFFLVFIFDVINFYKCRNLNISEPYMRALGLAIVVRVVGVVGYIAFQVVT